MSPYKIALIYLHEKYAAVGNTMIETEDRVLEIAVLDYEWGTTFSEGEIAHALLGLGLISPGIPRRSEDTNFQQQSNA